MNDQYSFCHLAEVEEVTEGFTTRTECKKCGQPCGSVHASSKKEAEEIRDALKDGPIDGVNPE